MSYCCYSCVTTSCRSQRELLIWDIIFGAASGFDGKPGEDGGDGLDGEDGEDGADGHDGNLLLTIS